MDRLAELAPDMMETVLGGFDVATIERMMLRARRRQGKPQERHRRQARGEGRGSGLRRGHGRESRRIRKAQEEWQPAVQAKPTRSRARLRLVLLVVIPLIALAAGAYFYLMSGRYISTDNAYVGAQKVLITPDISGKIARVTVTEGQRVKPAMR